MQRTAFTPLSKNCSSQALCFMMSSTLLFAANELLIGNSANADEIGGPSGQQIQMQMPQPEEEKEKPFIRATREYRHRMWAEAAEDFGAALPSEFNNPLLHYYYANCMVHLKHKEAAIREYRIAYALQPVGTIGQYCKMCLDKFGIDAEGKKSSAQKGQATKPDSKKTNVEIPEPPSGSELAALKVYPKDGSDLAIEREKSVQNLRALMEEKKRKGGAPLPSQVGTNFYVRNYKGPPAEPPAAPLSKTTQPTKVAIPAQRQPEQKKKWGLWWW